MALRKRIDRASIVIMKHIVVVSFLSSIINTVLLCISTSKETWMFGEISCQLHAMVCYVLLSSMAWLITLAAIERVYKCLSSGSYSMTFSEINTKILIFGMYMTAFFLCTGPMYGWGEYSQFKGLLVIKVQLVSKDNIGSANEFLCNTTITQGEVPNIKYFGELISSNLQDQWAIYIRSINTNCMTGDIHLTIRIRDLTSLTLFLDDVDSQSSGTGLHSLITQVGNNLTEQYSPSLIVDESDMDNYQNVLLPFQSLGICSLDFSSVNKYKRSATYYIFITTLVVPFVITALCGLVVLLNHYSGSIPNNIVYFKLVFFGSVLHFIASFPYYTVNFMNGSGHFIPKHINFLCTLLFYNASLCLTIPYLLYRRPKCSKRKSDHDRTFSMSNGIQDDIHEETELSRVEYV